MAARLCHYVLAKKLHERYDIDDFDRFLMGSLLPDAIEHNSENHTKTHFKMTHKNTKKLFDTKQFLETYKDLIRTDTLYLGYYLHLVQDAVYRKFLYIDRHFNVERTQAFIKELHNDYAIHNAYLIERYNLKPVNLKVDIEPLRTIYDFKEESLMEQFNLDFTPRGRGTTKHLKEEVIEDYLEICLNICCEEYEALKGERSIFDHWQYAWNRY